MTEIGIFLSSEEHGPTVLLAQAQLAEDAGFRSVFISDHFHPWIDAQGQSPFVWSVIGAIAATTRLEVMTGVTCPIERIHPAVVAHAAMTSHVLLGGRFVLGVGTGEALNEHVLGGQWPPAPVRLEMLEEALAVIRELWTGETTSHRGQHFTVENARLYTCAEQPPLIVMSAFGPQALSLAARIADGLVTTRPDAETVASYRRQGGSGQTIAATKVCWGTDERRARRLAHQLWPTECLDGQLNQELATPALFDAATSLVTEEAVAAKIPCGPDPELHAASIREYLEAGFDRVYVSQVGDDLEGFLAFYQKELRPRLDV